MKNLLLLLILVIVSSCTGEEDEFNYTVSFKNETQVVLDISIYEPDNDLNNSFQVLPLSNGGEVTNSSPTFLGYVGGGDSIVLRFPNQKGYICDARANEDIYCFQDSRNPLVGFEPYFNNLGNNVYEFVVTEEDFENAFELPQ